MTQPAVQRSFDLGRVIQDAFGAIRHNLATFAILAVVLAGIPAAVWGLGAFQMVGLAAGLRTGATPTDINAFGSMLGVILAGIAVGVIANAIQQAAVIYGTAAYLNGRPASFSECLSAGLRRCLPLIGMTILLVIAVWFGLIFFIVPGIMMAVAWVAAAPVVVVERTGVFGAFSRSADLTRGRRWALFALGAIFFIGVGVVQQVVLSIVRLAVPIGPPNVMANAMAAMAIQLPVTVLMSLVVGVLSSALVASAYYELRASREGVGPEALAAVFD